MERPDLSNVDPQIIAYIEFLEKKRNIHSTLQAEDHTDYPVSDAPLPAEPPTSIHIITISKTNLAKRTPRHLYPRQHRGGMGIFDLDVDDSDYPSALSIADEDQNLLLITNKARVYRQNLSRLSQTAVHAKGEDLFERIPLEDDEYVTVSLPVHASGYIALLSGYGRVRILRHHLFGEHLKAGTALFRYEEFGPLTAACWTPGDRDLFIASASGQGIRFNEKLISPQGDQGLKVSPGDQAVAITSVDDSSQVFLIGANGKGTLRPMSGFAANKSAGGSGKLAMKTDHLVGAANVGEEDEIFLITRLGKIIRFRVDEVPSSEGVIQGVNCMGLRGDEVTVLLRSTSVLD